MGDSPALTFLADDRYVGEGVSLGLARGLLGCYRGRNITQEGMGLGTVALRLGPFTYFAGTCETRTLAEGQFTKTFSLDRRLMWSLGKRSSVTLTRLFESTADWYMRWPRLQHAVLEVTTLIRRTLGLKQCFQPVDAVASGSFSYQVQGRRLTVHGRVDSLLGCLGKVFIMNELGADFFPRGLKGGTQIPPPSGWQVLPATMPTPALYNDREGVGLLLGDCATAGNVPFRIFWGRERTADLCWAGFELELNCAPVPATTVACRYVLEFSG